MASGPVQHFLCALLALAALICPVWAASFDIMDREGFDRPLVAYTATVPDGWHSQGRIAWSKPCSSSDLFETLFQTRAPDGLSGARIMPGYQFFLQEARLTPGYQRDGLLDLMLAQAQSANQNMATKFRGSNCAVGQLSGTNAILTQLILPNRPIGARVSGQRPNQSARAMMRQSFAGAAPGLRVVFDAQIVDLSYALNGTPISERLFLSWYSFVQEPIDMGGVTVASTHMVIEPLRFVWSPQASAANRLPRLEAVLNGMKTNPDWQRRVTEFRRRLQKQRNSDRARRDAENDRRHKEFIDSIRGTPSEPASSDPEPGTAESDTDFWGDPKPRTDYWGNEITE